MDTAVTVGMGEMVGTGTELLTIDEAFDLAHERAKQGRDVDIYCLRVPEFGISVYRVGRKPGWEFMARIFGLGSEAGFRALDMIFRPEGILTPMGGK